MFLEKSLFSQRIWFEATNRYFFLVPRILMPLQARKIIRILNVYIRNVPRGSHFESLVIPQHGSHVSCSDFWSRGCKKRIVETLFRPMKDGANMKKKWIEEVSEKKMAAVLIMQVEQVGLCLLPLKSKCG